MELILWRHADAEDLGANGDLSRQLTRKGHKQASAMAEWLRPRLEGEWRVLCSPAARALQTAVTLDMDIIVRPKLAPEGSAADLLREAGWPDGRNVVIVGHQPTLGEVAAELLGGRHGEVAVRKGSIWWFATRERDGALETVLKATVDPGMVKAA